MRTHGGPTPAWVLGWFAAAWALGVVLPAPVDADVLFAHDPAVPRAVQDFARNVIETRCQYQSHERAQRLFWAFRTRVRHIGQGVAYSIDVVSDVPSRKSDPPAFIEITVIDDGGIRLAALQASFIACSP